MRRIGLTLVVMCVWTISNVLGSGTSCEEVSPQVHAPADVVVSCCYWFSLGMLDDPNDATFGRFVYGQSKINKFKTRDKVCQAWCEYDRYTGYDPDEFDSQRACGFYNRYYSAAHPEQKHALVWGWDGWVDNWTSAVTIEVDDRRLCGTGLIVRRFIIEDRGIKYYDEQKIWIIDCDPFYVSDDCFDDEDDIDWPLFCQQPDPLDGCFADLSPSNPLLGRPIVRNGGDNQCNLISIDYKDDTITVEKGACLKVIRTWTVVDWCQYHPLKGQHGGRWEHVQIIKVRDKLDPRIECQIGDCNPAILDSLGNDCIGYIELRATGIDSCTEVERLRFEYKIDLFDDGTGPLGEHDVKVGPLSRITESPVHQKNPYAEHPDSVLNASGTYPLGTHRIYWFVEDGCGNVALCDTTFTVLDCKEPTPYCKPGIITVVMPSTQSVQVWAKDLDDGSFDNCSDSLTFSFSSDVNDTHRTFDCDSLGRRVVKIWVTDEEGNQDYCETVVEIQDGSGHCDSSSNFVARIEILPDAMTQTLPDLTGMTYSVVQKGIIVYSNTVTSYQMDVDLSSFSGQQLKLQLHHDVNPMKDVHTDDLIYLYEVLLGRKNFDHYAQKLAADLDEDDHVTARDLSRLRKALLNPDFANQLSCLSHLGFIAENAPFFDENQASEFMEGHIVDQQNLQGLYQFRPFKMGNLK